MPPGRQTLWSMCDPTDTGPTALVFNPGEGAPVLEKWLQDSFSISLPIMHSPTSGRSKATTSPLLARLKELCPTCLS